MDGELLYVPTAVLAAVVLAVVLTRVAVVAVVRASVIASEGKMSKVERMMTFIDIKVCDRVVRRAHTADNIITRCVCTLLRAAV